MKKKKAFMWKDYIFVINCSRDIDDVDSEFLYAVQKFATMILQNIETRKQKSDIRQDSLNAIKDTCDSWESFVSDRDAFFSELCASVASCYLSANLYVGKLMQSANSIEYVLASQFSSMKGKALRRDSMQGLSFCAVDTFSPIAVTKSDAVLCEKLHYFGSRETVEFPFVVVPLAAYLDCALGVLAADSLEDMTQDDEGNPNEAMSFLFAVANYLSTPMKNFFKADIRKLLLETGLRCRSFDEGFASFKNVILSILPYCLNVSYVAYDSTITPEKALSKPTTQVGMVYIMQLVQADCLIDYVTTPSVTIQWNNKTLIKSDCRTIGSEEEYPSICIIKIPEGTPHEDIIVRAIMYGNVDDKKHVLSKKSIGLQQMSNNGAFLTECDMECHHSPLPDARAGRLKFVSRLYTESDIIRIYFRQIFCDLEYFSHENRDHDKAIDPYCIVRWKNVEVGRTEVLRNNAKPSWDQLEFYIVPDEDDLSNMDSRLSLELWDTDAMGRGKCLGHHRCSLDFVLKQGVGHDVPLLHDMDEERSVGSIRYTKEVIYASNIDADIAEESLRIPFLSAFVDSENIKLDEGDDETDIILKNHRCELTFHSIRISHDILRATKYNESWDKSDDSHDYQPYCVLFFNGAEIGRTSSASSQDDVDLYCWDSEVFLLDVGGDVDLDHCKLCIDLWVVDGSSKGVKVGNLFISDKRFSSLLCTNYFVFKWYDICFLNLANSSWGEVLLGGHPCDGVNEVRRRTKPIENQTLLINVSNINLRFAPTDEDDKRLILFVSLNGARLVSCDLEGIRCEEVSEINCNTTFMKPYNKSMYELEMNFDIYHVGCQQPILQACLSKQDLVDFLDTPFQKSKWIDLVNSHGKCDESASISASIKVLGGPVNADVFVEKRNQRLGVDILGATGLAPPLYHNLRRPNVFCKVLWNEELVGQTAIVWNSSDPLWATHRFFLSLPIVEEHDDDHVLAASQIRIEVWAVSSLADRLEFLGCAEIEGDTLKTILNSESATLAWYPLEMSSQYTLEQQEFVCSKNGAVKVRIFGEGCTSDPCDGGHAESGGEYLLKVHRAEGLTEIDHFTKTNAKVIVYWNDSEVGRTAAIAAETNPHWEDEVFFVRAGNGESLADQYLQFHVYDTTGGVTGEFLGCVELHHEDLVNFFSQKLTDIHNFSLKESKDLDESDNRFVKGSLCVGAEIVSVPPVRNPVQLYSTSTLYVRGGINLPKANAFRNISDVTAIVYWTSLFDQVFDAEIGRTTIAPRTVNPSWQNEKFNINVPVVDEWTSVSVRIELRDIAAYHDSTFLGSVSLGEDDLKNLLSRTGDDCSVLLQYNVDVSSPLLLPEFSSYTTAYGDGEGKLQDSFLVLAGGAGNLVLSFDTGHQAGGAESLEKRSLLGNFKSNLSILSMKDRIKKRESKTLKFRIHEIHDIKLPEEVESLSISTVSRRLYFSVTFNDDTVRVKSVQGEEILSKSLVIKFNSEPFFTSFDRPQDEDLTTCTTQFDLWIMVDDDKSPTDNSSGASSHLDYFLGSLFLGGKDIVSLMRPKAPSRSFSLNNNQNIASSQNKYIAGASVIISGTIPNLLRQLSKQSEADSTRQVISRRSAVDSAISEMLEEEKIEIRIYEATGLVKNTSLLGNLFEYRAHVYLNEELKCSTGSAKGTLSVSSSTVDVAWESECITFNKPQGQNIIECKLVVEVTTNSSSCGVVSLGGEELLDFLESPEPVFHELAPSHGVTVSDQKNVQGKLYLHGRRLPGDVSNDDLSSDLKEFDTCKPLPDGMKDLNFYVLAAADLGKADKYGQSDPYCIVKWNGHELGKTEVAKCTLNPVWNEGKFKIRTYMNLGPKGNGNDKNFIKSYTAHDSLRLGRAVSDKGQRDRRRHLVPIAALKKDTFEPNTECALSIDVWDWNAMGNSIFLGSCELKGPTLADFFDCKFTKRNWYKLGKNKRYSRGSNKLVRGSIEISVGPVARENDTVENCGIVVEISAAKNLSKVDTYGQADPYCIVRWAQDICGITHVIKNTLNPEWENELFDIHFSHEGDIDEGFIYVEVWDHDVGAQGKFLGSILISGSKLHRLLEKGDFKWFKLSKSPFLTPSLQDLDINGSIRIRIGPMSPNKQKLPQKRTASFELTVVAADQLSNSAFYGNVDAFCILKVNGRELGTTSTVCGTSNPVWNEKFPLVLDAYMNRNGEECSDDRISIEIWSMLALARGEFLGMLKLDYAQLRELTLNCRSFKTSAREKAVYSLEKMASIPDSSQTHIKGSLRLYARYFGDADLKELGANAAAEVKLQWPVPAPLVPDTNQGLPSFEISILSVTDLIVPTKGKSHVTPDPFCLIYFNGQEIGTTSVCSNTCNPVWQNPDVFSVKIPENVESQSYWVTIKVYNMLSLERGEFLGEVTFSFWSLLCLRYGIFTLQLAPQLSTPGQFIKARITFSIDIHTPLWDGIHCYASPGIERKIVILNGKGLPKVNNLVPSTKCILMYDGGIKVRSPVVLSSFGPVWSPLPTLDVVMDFRNPKPVLVQVIYVDLVEKREFCLGEVTIPVDFILRPPAESTELWLGEPKKSAPKGYNFLLDGSVFVKVTANERTSAWKPWSSRLKKPLIKYPVEEIRFPADVENSKVEDAATLSSDELQWAGSVVCFSCPHVIPARPELMIIPIKGMGVVVDGLQVGTDPRKQYSLIVKRPKNKLTLSDPLMVLDNNDDIQKFVINLHRKDIFTKIRDLSLNKLRLFFENMSRKNKFNLCAIFKRMTNVISTCFPGTKSFIALLSKDSKSMRYSMFEKSIENESAPSLFTLWENEGVEWNCVGRHAGNGSTISVVDLIKADPKFEFVSFSRFQQFRSPRLCSPLVCGDVSLGVVGIESFDIYRAGTCKNLTELKPIQDWLDEVGSLCGSVLYAGRENNVLKLLESYVLLSSSSVSGLLKVLLENSLQILQGCRLMEIWSLRDRSLTSLATSWPESISAPKKWLNFRNIKVSYVREGGGALKSEFNNVKKKIGKIFFSKKDESATNVTGAGIHDDPDSASFSFLSKPCGIVFGIYYCGFEYYQFAEYFMTPKEKLEDFDHCYKDVKIYIGSDRDMWLSVYCIDEDLTILDQWTGKFQIVSFKEKAISLQLTNDGAEKHCFKCSCELLWPSSTSTSIQRAVQLKALEEVELFLFTIHSAHGLQKTDLVGSSDPFCEIYMQQELVGKTQVIKNNIEPIWEESFTVAPAVLNIDNTVQCRVEVWNMGFLGKGDFLGEVIIPLEQLLDPPTSDIEVELSAKASFNKSENKYVGGTIQLSYSVEKSQIDDDEVNEEMSRESSFDSEDSTDIGNGSPPVYDIPKIDRHRARRLCDIYDPILKLTVRRASGLAKADILSTANAYVKVFKLSVSEHTCSKYPTNSMDPVAITRVVEKSLSPVWNDELKLGLDINRNATLEGPHAGYDGGAGLLDKWPIFILEVWSKVKVGDGTFMGMISLNPLQYALKNSICCDLSPSPSLDTKGNKFVQGSVSLDFKIEAQNTESSANFFFFQSKYLLPATLASITIVSATLDGVANGRLRKNGVNPYCSLRWGSIKLGETAKKRNSLKPSWANEKFDVDMTKATNTSNWLDIVIEVRNLQEDESILLGEVYVPMVELLHPNSGEVIQRAIIKPSSAERREQSTKGFLNFRVSKFRIPQKISPKLRSRQCYPLNLKQFDKNKSDPISKHYSQENPRVLMTNPVNLEIIRDPNEERRRQESENIDLPGVISRIDELNNKYTTAIFDQIGLISEVHFGQTISSFQRQAPTVLHVGDADCFLLPIPINDTKKHSHVEMDLLKKCPKRKKLDLSDGKLCLVSRYPKECLPQRDVQFLKKLQEIISKSIFLFECRQQRKNDREAIISKLRAIYADIHRYSPEDIIQVTAADSKIHFECNVDIYILKRINRSYLLVRCSSETGTPEEAETGVWDTDDFVDQSAKLCRHGLMLQFYRGRSSVASMDWKKGFSEASLLSLQCIREDVRCVEPKKLIQQLENTSRQKAPMGACMVPLLVKSEYLVGVMCISGTDKIPHSVYRLNRKETDDVANHEVDITEEDIETHQLFEEGTSDCMRNIGLRIGNALCSSARVSCLREVKTFPIRHDTDPNDIIRYCFRMLAEALPIISEISLWRVAISPIDECTQSLPEDQRYLIAAGSFKSENVFSLLSTPNEKNVYKAHYDFMQKRVESKFDNEERESASSGRAEKTLSAAKEIYANTSPWTVDLPALLIADEFGTENSEMNEFDSSESSSANSSCSDDSNITSDEVTANNEVEPIGLSTAKSFFGGFFSSKKVKKSFDTSGHANPDENDIDIDNNVELESNVTRAHAEINRCISDLEQSNFYLNSGGGVYLSLVSQRSDVVDKILKPKFDLPCVKIDAMSTSSSNLNSTPGASMKNSIPGTRGVNLRERLVHVSEVPSPPPIQNAPLPKGIRAKKDIGISSTKQTNKKEDMALKTDMGLRYEYFVAVRAKGLGHDDGWGNIGEEASKTVDNIKDSMVDLLSKFLTASSKNSKID